MHLFQRISTSLQHALGTKSKDTGFRQDLGSILTGFWQVTLSGLKHVPLLRKVKLWTDLLMLEVYKQMGATSIITQILVYDHSIFYGN